MEIKFLDFCKDNLAEPSIENYGMWLHGYGFGQFRLSKKLLAWAEKRKEEETLHRPDVNIHKKNLVITWNQVIRKLGGRDGKS